MLLAPTGALADGGGSVDRIPIRHSARLGNWRLAHWLRLLQPFAEDDHVVMVSHQPFVSHAVAHWTDDATLAPIAPGGYSVLDVLDLQRGGVTCLRHCTTRSIDGCGLN